MAPLRLNFPKAVDIRTASVPLAITRQLHWEAVLRAYPSGAGKGDKIAAYSVARSTR